MNPTKIIHLPRYHVGRRWTPEEILAIKSPPEIKEKTRKSAAIAATRANAAGAGKRGKKKAERKKRVLSFITSKQRLTTTDLLSLMGERINRTTVYELTKELEAEGLIHKIGWEWTLKTGTINDSSN